jgi:hypothetical protein
MSWANVASAGASLVGGYMASRGGGGPQQAGTQTVKTEAPDYIASQYERLASDINQIRDTGLLEDVQRLSDYEKGLIQQGMARAAAVDPFQAAGEQAVSGLLAGGGLLGEAADLYRGVGGMGTMASPEFQAAASRQVDKALRPLTSQFALGGRLGSGAFAERAGEAAAEALSPMMLQARQQDIANQLSAARGLTGISGQRTADIGAGLTGAAAVGDMPFTNIQRGLGLGGLLSSEEFAIRQAPLTAAQRYADLLKGATVGEQTTRPLYAPSGPTGGQMLGATLAQSAPQIGQAFGSYMQNRAASGPTFGGVPTSQMSTADYYTSATAG